MKRQTITDWLESFKITATGKNRVTYMRRAKSLKLDSVTHLHTVSTNEPDPRRSLSTSGRPRKGKGI